MRLRHGSKASASERTVAQRPHRTAGNHAVLVNRRLLAFPIVSSLNGATRTTRAKRSSRRADLRRRREGNAPPDPRGRRMCQRSGNSRRTVYSRARIRRASSLARRAVVASTPTRVPAVVGCPTRSAHARSRTRDRCTTRRCRKRGRPSATSSRRSTERKTPAARTCRQRTRSAACRFQTD